MRLNSLKSTGSLGAMLTAGALSLAAVTASAETMLTVWSWDPNFNGDSMQRAMARYQAEHPDVSLVVADFGKDALEQKLQSQLASGSNQGLPDIVLIEDYAAQRFLLTFPQAFEPVGEHIDLSGMAPYKVALATVDGTAYSMPFDSGVTGVFYHRADLEAAGFAQDDLVGITWDRFIEIGQSVEAVTGKDFLVQPFNRTDLLRLMLQSAGTWYTTPDGAVSLGADPRFRKVVEEYIKVMTSGIVQDAAGWTEYVGAFTSHDVSGVATAAWITAAIKANADQAGEWAVAPIPRIDGIEGAVHASNVGGSSWYVMAEGPNTEVALDFLNDVWAGDSDFYADILADKGAVGSLLAARHTAAYDAPDPFFADQKIWADFADWLGVVPEVNFGVFTFEAEAAFLAYVPDVIRGDAALDDALETYERRLTQAIR